MGNTGRVRRTDDRHDLCLRDRPGFFELLDLVMGIPVQMLHVLLRGIDIVRDPVQGGFGCPVEIRFAIHQGGIRLIPLVHRGSEPALRHGDELLAETASLRGGLVNLAGRSGLRIRLSTKIVRRHCRPRTRQDQRRIPSAWHLLRNHPTPSRSRMDIPLTTLKRRYDTHTPKLGLAAGPRRSTREPKRRAGLVLPVDSELVAAP
jgi:hypothetical protein